MGYSVPRIDEIEPAGPGGACVSGVYRFDPETTRQPVAGPDGFTQVAIGARPGSCEPRGPF
jgi:hypothetical protein